MRGGSCTSGVAGIFFIAAGLATIGIASASADDLSRKMARDEPAAYDAAAAQALDEAGLAFKFLEGDFAFEPCGAAVVVFFDLDSSELTPVAKKILADSLSGIDRNCVNISVSIEAATDSSGSAKRNQALSERRAEAVRSEIAALGFSGSQISVSAVGETKLLRATADGTREPSNRRASVAASGEQRPDGLAAAVAATRGAEKLPTTTLAKADMPQFGLGDRNTEYDIVLQPGHYLRTSGATGASGAKTSEQSMASQIVGRMARLLRDRGRTIVVLPADDFRRPLKTKVFLTVHFDGADPACSSNSSLGYGDDAHEFASHAFGFALASALGKQPKDFMNDNFTKNLREYYAFKHMNADRFEGIIEVGELSCPAQEEVLIDRAHLVAENLALAVEFMLNIAAER